MTAHPASADIDTTSNNVFVPALFAALLALAWGGYTAFYIYEALMH